MMHYAMSAYLSARPGGERISVLTVVIVEPGTFTYSTVGRLNDTQYITFYARNTMGQEGVACRVFEDEWLEG
jgi:hypothetical protein